MITAYLVSFKTDGYEAGNGLATYRVDGETIQIFQPNMDAAVAVAGLFEKVFQQGRSSAFRVVRMSLDAAMSKARADMKLPRET